MCSDSMACGSERARRRNAARVMRKRHQPITSRSSELLGKFGVLCCVGFQARYRFFERLIKPAKRALLVSHQGVLSQDRQSDAGAAIDYDVVQVRVLNLAPASGLAGSGTGEAAPVRRVGCELDE